MPKWFLFFILVLFFHSCSTDNFNYPSELASDVERKQFDEAVWIIYKFQYQLPIYEVDSPFKSSTLSLKKINVPFAACDIFLRGIEKMGDTVVFKFGSRYNGKNITHGPKEDDGIPNITFIGSSDSIRSWTNFYVMDFPQKCDADCDSFLASNFVRINSFVYDTLGDSDFITHIKDNKKVISPTLRFICQKRGLSLTYF